MARSFRLLLGAAFLLGMLPAGPGAAAFADTTSAAPAAPPSVAEVRATRWDGPIGPVTARYLSREIRRANDAGAGLLVIGLDTPGGLDTAMREIVRAISASRTPVAVWVGPSGSRAASAGCVIGIAAHLLAMAPGTNIGAAHPVSIGGGAMDSTMSGKVAHDAAAYVEALAAERGRNAAWAREAVEKSASIAAEEAVRIQVADYLASDLAAVVRGANGRTVRAAGGPILLATAGARIVERVIDWRTRTMTLFNDPNVAYILLLLGIYGLFFELSNPGSLFPGVFGAISLVLGLYALSNLSVNYAGLLLIFLGAVMLLAEIKIPSHGLLTVGGITSLTLGSLFLIDSPLPFFRVSLALIVPAVLFTALFFLFLVGKGLAAQRRRVMSGEPALVGQVAEVRTRLAPRGAVFVQGTHWSAEAPEPVEAGEKVVITAVEGLVLKVRRLS